MIAVLCLASVIFAEARGEPLDGQIAVGQVVLNRVSDPQWPDSVCAVTKQRRQFASLKPDAQAIELAEQLLNGDHEDISKGATYFFSGPDPYWAKNFEVVSQIDNHTFMHP